ncbi:MAG: TolC family outer membrane protein [Ottowia sp.]|nr:TolC family outer membrane protein [Ottowia sp.]
MASSLLIQLTKTLRKKSHQSFFKKATWIHLMVITCISQAHALDFLAVYQRAQSADPNFEAARYALAVAQEKIPQARAGLLPTISANGNKSYNKAKYTFGTAPQADRNTKSWNWALQLTQPLLRAQNWQALNQAQALLEQAQAQFTQAEQDLILRVAQAYFEFDIARETMAVAQAQVKALEQQRALVQQGFAKGTHAITEVHEATSRFELARAQQLATRHELASKQADVEKIIGTLPAADLLTPLKPDATIPLPAPHDIQPWLDLARENAPAVRAQRAAIAAAEFEIKKNQAAHFPTLDLTTSYGHSYASNSAELYDYQNRTGSAQVGLQLTIPIYAGGAMNAKVREAIAERHKANAELEAATRQVSANAQQAFFGVINGVSQIDALKSAVTASRSEVKGNQVGYRLGTRLNLDVLNAERQLYTAQRDLIKARYDTLMQGLKLKAATGSLTQEDVLSLNQLF